MTLLKRGDWRIEHGINTVWKGIDMDAKGTLRMIGFRWFVLAAVSALVAGGCTAVCCPAD